MIRVGRSAAAIGLTVLALAGVANGQATAPSAALKDCMVLPDPDRNIADCTTVIERGEAETKRTRAIAHLNRAIAYLQKNDLARGLADLDTAIALDPTMAGAYYNRALYHHRAGDLARAKADYAAAIRLDPTMVNAYGNLAAIHYLEGALDLALQGFEAALALAPNNAGLIHQIGLVYFAKGDVARALARFDTAIGLAPKAARFRFSRARAYAHSGELERAREDFAAAHEIDRSHAETKACLAAVDAALDARRRGARMPPLPGPCVRDTAVRS
jgi:Tfp pilus assembly protein PilF